MKKVKDYFKQHILLYNFLSDNLSILDLKDYYFLYFQMSWIIL